MGPIACFLELWGTISLCTHIPKRKSHVIGLVFVLPTEKLKLQKLLTALYEVLEDINVKNPSKAVTIRIMCHCFIQL